MQKRNRLKELRLRKGNELGVTVTQQEVADFLHVSVSSVSRYESGYIELDNLLEQKFAEYYNVEVPQLYYDEHAGKTAAVNFLMYVTRDCSVKQIEQYAKMLAVNGDVIEGITAQDMRTIGQLIYLRDRYPEKDLSIAIKQRDKKGKFYDV